MIGDQIKAATLLGAYAVHDEYVPEPGYPPLGTPELHIRMPYVTYSEDYIDINPLWRNSSHLLDDVFEHGIDYEDDRKLVCSAVAEHIRVRVERVQTLISPTNVLPGEWFRVLPGKPFPAYILPEGQFPYVDVLTAESIRGPWVPLPRAMPLTTVLNVVVATGLFACAKLNEDLDDYGVDRWAKNIREYGAICASLWADHNPPQRTVQP